MPHPNSPLERIGPKQAIVSSFTYEWVKVMNIPAHHASQGTTLSLRRKLLINFDYRRLCERKERHWLIIGQCLAEAIAALAISLRIHGLYVTMSSPLHRVLLMYY